MNLIYSDRNLGFAGANNLGARHARGSNLLFLNPDTIVRRDAIERMARHLNDAPDIGIVGCRLLNPDLTLQTSSVQPFPGIANQLFGIDWLKRRTSRLRLWGMSALYAKTAGPVEVDAVSGACLMARRERF